jgi:P-type Cu+ transporter
VTTATREIVLDIEGMTCASCVQKVERALGSVDGVQATAVNLATRTATVRGSLDGSSQLIGAVAHAGYGARPHDAGRDPAEEERAYRRRLIVVAPLTIVILALTFIWGDASWSAPLAWILATPVVAWGGWPFFRNAARAARHGTTTMDTLVALGAASAYLYSAWEVIAARDAAAPASHYFDTAAVIVTLILVGKLLESRARASAGDASRALLARAATHATVVTDGMERTIPIDQLRPGMRAIVRPGEKVPADGVVRAGASWVDLSLLTGESTPVDVGPGDEVIGASINGGGLLEIFVTKVGPNAALGEVVRLLQAAQGSKAGVQRLADRVSSVFVPIVLLLAAATLAVWIVLGNVSFGDALLHATAVVLIACPCALGLATPAALVAGTGRAAELGVLFKGGSAVETAAEVDTVLLDKTGTVTDGAMRIVDVRGVNGAASDEVLALAAAVERGSTHPIARAVVRAAEERGVAIPAAAGHAIEPGAGAAAEVGGSMVRVGRPAGLPHAMLRLVDAAADDGRTPFAVWREDVPIGLAVVGDHVKPDAAAVVANLRSMGIAVALVTGDVVPAARSVARSIGVVDVIADVRPDGKVAEIDRRAGDGHRVAFVGDGVNDAPALAAASVGIAIGSGTDVALAAADVQLLSASLEALPRAIGVARRTRRVIRQNLFWAFAYNVVMIPLAVLGLLDPMLAAAAMAASSVSVVANALRLRRFDRQESP